VGVVAAAVLVGFGLLQERQPEEVAREPEAERALAAEGYAGAESCRECHQEIYDEWSRSAHAIAMAPADPGKVQGDFVHDTTHVFDTRQYKMFTRDGTYYIRAMGADGKVRDWSVTYVLGARQHEVYLTRFPDGRYQILPVYYDLAEKRWYDSAEGTFGMPRALRRDEWLFWANRGRTWNERCLNCHASQMRKNYDMATDTYRTVVGDLSINCEACHGPGAEHNRFWMEAVKDPTVAREGKEPLVDLLRLPGPKQLEVCAQCHALKTVLRSGFEPGDAFLDYYEPRLIDSEGHYWPDGLVREQAYPYLQFAGSLCFRKGNLMCTGCHGAHGGERPVDMITDPGKGGLCARCHPEIMSDVGAHTFHNPGGLGSDCNACHAMRMYLNRMTVTDHRLGVPVPELSVRLGVPNACSQEDCHADKTAEWASEWARKWYGDYQDAHVERAQAVAWGRDGDARSLPVLMRLVADRTEDPLLRAGSAGLLGRVRDSSAVHVLMTAMADTNQVVRYKAAIALGEIGHPRAIPALRRALDDSVFTVRIRAAYCLAQLDYWPVTEMDRTRYRAVFTEHEQMVTQMLADSPEAHVTLGETFEYRRRYPEAALSYQRALRIDARNEAAQGHVTRLVESESRFRKLEEMLGPASGKDARAAAALGMAYGDRGRWDDAVAMLERADSPSQRSGLVALGLGEVYRRLGRLEDAEEAYRRATATGGGLPGAHRGLALIAYTRGRTADGDSHWTRFLEAERAGEHARRVRGMFGGRQ